MAPTSNSTQGTNGSALGSDEPVGSCEVDGETVGDWEACGVPDEVGVSEGDGLDEPTGVLVGEGDGCMYTEMLYDAMSG